MKCKGILNEEASLHFSAAVGFLLHLPSSSVQKQQKEELFEKEPTKYCGPKDMQRGAVF